MWYHRYLHHDILFPVHIFVQVKIFHVYAHSPCFEVWDGAVYTEFHCGHLWCWCSDISCIIYKIYYCSESCPMSICFLSSDIAYCSCIDWISVLWFVLVEDEFYCVCYWIFFIPGIGGHVRCTLSLSIPVHSYWLGICILIFFLWFCSWCGLLVVLLWLYLFWGLCERVSMCLCVLSFFLPYPF